MGRAGERLGLLPRTDNYWFSRIRSVADSLIHSDFFIVTSQISLYYRYILVAFGFLCSSFRVTLELQGPQAERSASPDFLRFASKPDVFTPTRRPKKGHGAGLCVENINDKTCEFRNMIRGSAKGEANGLPDQDEAFRRSSSKLPVNPF